MSLLWLSFAIFVFLMISAFFSGNETGLLSCSYLKAASKAKENDSLSKILLHLLNRKNQMILVCLIGINMANTLYSLSFNLFFQKINFLNELSTVWSSFIQTSILTLILVVVAEIFPKTLFYEYSFRLTRKSSRILIFLKKVMQPFIGFVFSNSWSKQIEKPNLELETIRMMTMQTKNSFVDHQQSMIHHITSLKQTSIKSLMFSTHAIPKITIENTLREAWVKITDDETPFFIWKDSKVKYVLELKNLYSVPLETQIKNLKLNELKSFQSTTKGLELLRAFFKGDSKNEIALIEERGYTIGYINLQRLLNPISSFTKS